jgi:hypothetical protein
MTSKGSLQLAMVAVSVATGTATVLAPSPAWREGLSALFAISISFLVFAWYCVDAREHSYCRRWLLDFGVAGATLIGLPWYLFQTRGALRGGLATGGFVLGYLGLVVASVVGGFMGLVLSVFVGHSGA